MQNSLTPKAIVAALDAHIVGQSDAKRAVAVALRNRWRRQQLPAELRSEVTPKNILMIGPTGCGKTEISRRLAKLADAPFIKVEATKFTEVGYVGRDVDQIIRDLVEVSMALVREKKREDVKARAHQAAGDEVVIVTATNEFVTRPIAQAFGVSELIAVELERGADGWITGEIRGVPSARAGKVTRVEQWLAQRKWGWDDVESTFYSDSANDLPLLEKVNHPVATNPDPRLREIARTRGWRILDLFDKIG